jgi:hypothetical protein
MLEVGVPVIVVLGVVILGVIDLGVGVRLDGAS